MKKEKVNFEQYFSEIYGQRWHKLSSSLKNPSQQVMRPNALIANAEILAREVTDLPFYDSEKSHLIQELSEGLKKYYVMDLASILCAKALEVKPSDFVLDMCAAPGGKSLILFENLKEGVLWCNEISSARRQKLKNVIREYIPESKRDRIFIKGKDGSRYGLTHPDTFDKILVDAPCSGERHLIHSPKELEKWSPKRTKRLAATQYSLLCSALLACKSGGQIVYSTCSISPQENDEVIKKILMKKSDFLVLDKPNIDHSCIEETEYGLQILPDRSEHGPIYFSRLLKK